MICVSLAEPSADDCLKALEDVDFAEIRIDRMSVDEEETRSIFLMPKRLIATCRPGTLDDEARKRLLLAAVGAGASYVDIEVEAEDGYRKAITASARSKGCKVIISFHDYEKTPEKKALGAVVARCFEKGADVCKIACKVDSETDNARLLGLLDCEASKRGKIVVVGMGEKGRVLRIVAPLLGSPFTFASLSKGKETAEGQIDKDRLRMLMEIILYV